MDKVELERTKRQLQQRLERIRQDLAGGLDKDAGEQAVQRENRDFLLEIVRVTEEELEKVNDERNGT